MYDAIIVGARCAGAPTAMLLAQRGHKVLLLDKASFPSDKMSTHFILPPGIEQLESWGLLDAVKASGCPPITRFDVFMGDRPLMQNPMDSSPAYCPRRYLLDKILVDAAVAAGAELREAFTVDEITIVDGVVTGLKGHARGGASLHETARLIVGADGHHSVVAKAVNAPKYREREPLTCGYYSYWSGVPMRGAEVHVGGGGGVLAFPTNDEMVCIAAGSPHSSFHAYREDVETSFYAVLDASPEFAARVRAGKREERFVGTADLPNFFRKPFGPGWALVGDAGYMKDPITGSGISDAFRDATLLAIAADEVFSSRRPFDEAMSSYQEQRDTAASANYEMTLQTASGELVAALEAQMAAAQTAAAVT